MEETDVANDVHHVRNERTLVFPYISLTLQCNAAAVWRKTRVTTCKTCTRIFLSSGIFTFSARRFCLFLEFRARWNVVYVSPRCNPNKIRLLNLHGLKRLRIHGVAFRKGVQSFYLLYAVDIWEVYFVFLRLKTCKHIFIRLLNEFLAFLWKYLFSMTFKCQIWRLNVKITQNLTFKCQNILESCKISIKNLSRNRDLVSTNLLPTTFDI